MRAPLARPSLPPAARLLAAAPLAVLAAALVGCASPPIETDVAPSIPSSLESVAVPDALDGERREEAAGEGSAEAAGEGTAAGDVVDGRSGGRSGGEPAGGAPLEVLWGGVLLGASNLDDSTQLEVLAYPLDRRQRPMTGRDSAGRFLILADGYLETLDYADGRLVTVLGAREGVREGRVGDAPVVWPVVRSEQLHLWRDGAAANERPRFTFGLGVSLGN